MLLGDLIQASLSGPVTQASMMCSTPVPYIRAKLKVVQEVVWTWREMPYIWRLRLQRPAPIGLTDGLAFPPDGGLSKSSPSRMAFVLTISSTTPFVVASIAYWGG